MLVLSFSNFYGELYLVNQDGIHVFEAKMTHVLFLLGIGDECLKKNIFYGWGGTQTHVLICVGLCVTFRN